MKGCGRGEGQRIAIKASGAGRGWDTHAGMAQCHRRRFRAPARCRSETGAPSRPRYRSAVSAKAGSGAGFALPRDAGRRPALQAVPALVPRLRQRQEAAQVSRSRAMPVGDRRSKPSRLSLRGFGKGRKWCRFRAPARCRSETGAPAVPALVPRLRQRQEAAQVSRSRAMPVGDRRSSRPRARSAASAKAGSGAGFALPRDAGRRPALQPSPRSFRGFGKGRKRRRFRAPARCRSETGAPGRPGYRSAASAKAGSGAGFALPRDAGRRPALQAVPAIAPRLRQRQEAAQVSRSRAMPVGDRRSKPSRLSLRGFGKGRKRCRFRAPARCRSETGAPLSRAILPLRGTR